MLKCNAMEAAVLAGMTEPHDTAGIERVAAELRARGVATVYLTAGRRGVHFASDDESGWAPAPDVEVTNATGAGDAFSAGVVWGMLQGDGRSASAQQPEARSPRWRSQASGP